MNDKEILQVLQDMTAKGMSTAQQFLALNMDTRALRTNATLRYDEWKHFDTAVVTAARDRLVGWADLLGRGLRFGIGNGMASTLLVSEKVNNPGTAILSMDGLTPQRNDRQEYGLDNLPLPITHDDFSFSARSLAISRSRGEGLDTTRAMVAAQNVADKIEYMLFRGASTYNFAGGIIYGYTDWPSRQTGSLNADWATFGATGGATAVSILDDVLVAKQKLIDHKKYGPYVIYIPTNWETVLDQDYDAERQTTTIRERIKKVGGIADIKVADKMVASQMLMVSMQSDVIRAVEGMPITTVEWDTDGAMKFNFKVMSIAVPQLRVDADGNSGVVHLS
jgi:hypothetical protein